MAGSMLEKARALSEKCACGAKHSLTTKEVYIGKDVLTRLAFNAADLAGGGHILLVMDQNTRPIAGEAALRVLHETHPASAVVLAQDAHGLHADARAIGETLLAVQDDTRLLVAVGSGTINDITRYVAHRTHLPYLVLGTAPSMDGYCSGVSPILKDGLKLTFNAVSPRAVLLSPALLADAPKPMQAAGFGDMLGKHIALLDWELSAALTGESHCAQIAALMAEATALCENSAGDAGLLGEGLCLSGLAMQLMGNSRPASGAEHHISHFLELRRLSRGESTGLHGDKVGLAALLMIRAYAWLYAKKRPLGEPPCMATWTTRLQAAYGATYPGFAALNPLQTPKEEVVRQYSAYAATFDAFSAKAAALVARVEEYAQLLVDAGGPSSFAALGFGSADVKDALLCAFLLRPRFTALRMAYNFGWLEEMADALLG